MVKRIAAMALAAGFIGVAQGADLTLGRKPAPVLPGVSTGTASEQDAALNAAKVPRAVIIKLRDTVTECLSCRAAAGRSLNALMPGSRLGDLLSRHGMKSVHPLRPAAPGSLVPESRAVAQQRRAANRARFTIRSSRAPRGAQRVELQPNLRRALAARSRHGGCGPRDREGSGGGVLRARWRGTCGVDSRRSVLFLGWQLGPGFRRPVGNQAHRRAGGVGHDARRGCHRRHHGHRPRLYASRHCRERVDQPRRDSRQRYRRRRQRLYR